MKEPAENIIRMKIGNTDVRISDKYVVKTPETVEEILHRIAARAQPELGRKPHKKGYYHL